LQVGRIEPQRLRVQLLQLFLEAHEGKGPKLRYDKIRLRARGNVPPGEHNPLILAVMRDNLPEQSKPALLTLQPLIPHFLPAFAPRPLLRQQRPHVQSKVIIGWNAVHLGYV
jgi:hypothetical protein